MKPAVYIYKKTADNGQELKYSLRSLTNLTNWNGEVFIAGDTEDWFSDNVQVIDGFTNLDHEYSDAQSKLTAITNDDRVPDEFIFLNDDFYIAEPTELKPLHGGKLEGKPGKNAWQQSKHDTAAYLQAQGINQPLDYAIHVPMPLNKHKLAGILDILERRPQLMMRSLYGNLYDIGGQLHQDQKTSSGKLKTGKLLSTKRFSPELIKLFPNKSIFEKEIT